MGTGPDTRNEMTLRLIAVDVDGTLLRSDGTVAPEDRAAIAAALERGIAVTLATGRLSSSAIPYARELALQVPLVCADGAVLFCPTRCIPLSQRPLAVAGLNRLLGCLRDEALAPFVFTHEAVCGAADDFNRFPFVAGWTPMRAPHDDLAVAAAAAGLLAPITAIGVGSELAVLRAHERLRADPSVADELAVFPIRTTEHWVLRLTPGGCSKAQGLAQVTEQLAISPSEVVAIGDWYNDVSMLKWAGQSFAMGQAPDEVKEAAKHALRSTAETGGAVAEALAYLDRG
jgi:hydroxymethylpyrimidine pyrophosphatase-like HAD family hydrolase